MAEFEDGMQQLHAQSLAAEAAPGLASFFEQLAKQDAEHKRQLQAALEEERNAPRPGATGPGPRVRG